MNTAELLAMVATVTGSHRVRVDAPLTGAVLLAGIEVVTTTSIAERTLRQLWRHRSSGAATPLLLLADDPTLPGCVLALGPVDVAGPLRSVEAGALSDVLQRLSGSSRLDAVRELAVELDRLDQAGIPGLKLRDLLTLHTLDVRVRSHADRWARARQLTKSITRVSDWRAVLTSLGYQLERRRNRGYLARWAGRPVAVVHPLRDPAEFSRLDAEGRPPEGLLLNDCLADGASFGLLASSGRLRLFDVDPAVGSAASRYVDLDAGALQDDDRGFLALLTGIPCRGTVRRRPGRGEKLRARTASSAR